MSEINAINALSYSNPMELLYNPNFLAAYQTPNPNSPAFKGAQQPFAYEYQLPQYSDLLPQPSLSNTNVPFKASEQTEKGGGSNILGWGALALLVAGAGYAAYKGKGNPIEGAKTIWKSLKGKFGSEAKKAGEKAAKKVSLKNADEYTISKGGTSIVIKDGKPIKIITKSKKEITDSKKVQAWVEKNTDVIDEIKGLSLSGKLPKGVSLSYTETITDGDKVYKLTVENGKVAEVYGKNKKDADGKFIRVADEQMAKFLENHEGVVKKAETLEHTIKLKKVTVRKDESKPIVGKDFTNEKILTNKNVALRVRNGRVVGAKVNGRELTPDELGRLQNEHHDIISQFGRNIEYGLKGKDVEYIYRQKGGQKVRFTKDASGKVDVKSVNSVTEEIKTGNKEIEEFLKNNKEINDGIDVAKNGTLPEGFRLGAVTVKSKSGNVYSMTGETVTEVKLADGTVKKGEDLKEWLKLAENKNEYDKILESLK